MRLASITASTALTPPVREAAIRSEVTHLIAAVEQYLAEEREGHKAPVTTAWTIEPSDPGHLAWIAAIDGRAFYFRREYGPDGALTVHRWSRQRQCYELLGEWLSCLCC
ncbi:hypothetical protein [Streptomyces sp. NPDC015125]|uniref:hypothetical protein n=1 Tax=Streptomyces sp. NPDC015125 TaxID=3364938 RepID=UPI003701DF0E